MTEIICASKVSQLIESDTTCRVLLYGNSNKSPDGYSIGNSIFNQIRRLDYLPNQRSFDFLSIALSVVAADKFLSRAKHGVDGFSRNIHLTVSLANPEPWEAEKGSLQKILNFLSSDNWLLDFQSGGQRVPTLIDQRGLRKFTSFTKSNSICMFSGGMDSFIGSIVVESLRKPILVSRSPAGDQKYQRNLADVVPHLTHAVINDYPTFPDDKVVERENTTRARSFLFLALGVLYASALARTVKDKVPVIIPENGFIAVNPPLTKRRIGANTTRTAHPYYLSSMKNMLRSVGIPFAIENPFKFMTKGEMLENVKNRDLIKNNICSTVSCSHWVRNHEQCGRCWPCLIRRSAFLKAKFPDTTKYTSMHLKSILNDPSKNSDLVAFLYALRLVDKYKRKSMPYRSIRFLPTDPQIREKYLAVVDRGFEELREFFFEQEIWPS